MIDGLKPYPEYQESGLPWLGHLPVGWNILRGKGVFHVIDVRSESGKEEILTVSASDGVIPRRNKAVTMFMAKSYIGHKLCWPGDLVVNSLWAWMQGLGFSKYHGLISSAYSVYRPRLEFAQYWRFFHYLLRSTVYKWELQTRSKGVWLSRLQLSDLAFLDMPILLPPKEEVSAIVKFLDHATRRLNHAIRAKQKMIALLNEQKQVIIHRAVTRGLDPDVPLKPSGTPWLGDIPRHWELVSLKSVCFIQSGVTLGKYYAGQSLIEYPYLRVANVQSGHLNLEVLKSLQLPADEANRYFLKVGDVLMTEGGDPDKLGRGCVWEGQVSPCLHQNHIFAVRPNAKKLIPKYLSAILGSDYAKNYFLLTAKQTTNLASTNKSTMGKFHIPLPNLQEQNSILFDIERLTSPIDQTVTQTERQIDLFQEFRIRLIANVVTGKLDVREAVRHLPNDKDEVEPDIETVDAVEEEFQESQNRQENIKTDFFPISPIGSCAPATRGCGLARSGPALPYSAFHRKREIQLHCMACTSAHRYPQKRQGGL